jgi:tetratricopeptide (TPR) repeat protein
MQVIGEMDDLKVFGLPGFLAHIIYERGKVLQSMFRIEEAFEDYTHAIEQFKHFHEEGLLPKGMSDYAEALLSRAFILTMKEHHQEALADYNQALKIIQQFQGGDELPERSLMANLYTNRAVTLIKLGSAEEALLDFDDALEIVRKLESNNCVTDHNVLLMCYFNRAVALEIVDRPEDALADLEKCVVLIETASTKNEMIDLDELFEMIRSLKEAIEENDHYK